MAYNKRCSCLAITTNKKWAAHAPPFFHLLNCSGAFLFQFFGKVEIFQKNNFPFFRVFLQNRPHIGRLDTLSGPAGQLVQPEIPAGRLACWTSWPDGP